MGQHASQAKHAARTPPRRSSREVGASDPTLVIRLVIAAVIFAVALIVKTSAVVRVVLLIVSAVIAGYDVFLEAINSVEEGKYFAKPLVVVFVTAVAFVVGFHEESSAMLILYQLGMLAVSYASKQTHASALALAKGQSAEVQNRLREILDDQTQDELQIEQVMGSSAGLILRLAMVVAVIYAIALPLLTALPFRVSIHRALMIILIATPASIVTAMPLAGLVALARSAGKGIIFPRATSLEKAEQIELAVFDKAGVFSDDCPQVLAIQSSVLDRDTFMNFAAHATYFSDQPFAKAIANVFNQEYKLDVVSDFKDLPGHGVEVKIGGNPVVLANAAYLSSRGINVPRDPNDEGQAFFLVVAGRYVGKIILSENVNANTEHLAAAMRESGIKRCVLLTEDSAEEGRRLAEELGFDDFCEVNDTPDRLQYLHEQSAAQKRVMYVYANGIEQHSDAQLDLRVSTKGKYADAIILPDHLGNLPDVPAASRRLHQIAVQNAVFAFVIKAVLIFLSVIGWCTLWFAMFLDIAATLATILNTIRVSTSAKRQADEDEDEDY